MAKMASSRPADLLLSGPVSRPRQHQKGVSAGLISNGVVMYGNEGYGGVSRSVSTRRVCQQALSAMGLACMVTEVMEVGEEGR